jgi:hypothetical protein
VIPQILSVTFVADVQSGGHRFSVPVDAARALGIDKGDIALTVTRISGEPVFAGVAPLTSGLEITSIKPLAPDETILVIVSRPPGAQI